MRITSDFRAAHISVTQDTPVRPDWGTNDYLAALRVITNSQQLILAVSGVLKYNDGSGNNGIAILLDTDPATGTNIMPNLSTTTYRAKNMAGMVLDQGFGPDYALIIGLQEATPAETAWVDFSKLVAGGNNDYFGELTQPVTSYGALYGTDYMIGLKLTGADTNLAHALWVDNGLELALTYAKLNVKTNFVKLQVIEINHDGSYYSNQSLPPIGNYPQYNGGPCAQARFDLIPGDQHLTLAIPLVTNLNRAPVLNAIGDKTVVAGQTLQFNVSAYDDDGPAPQVLASGLPPGALFTTNGASGVFTWVTTLADLGVYSVTFRAFDGRLADAETIIIEVAEDRITWCNLQWPPVITSYVDQVPSQVVYGRVHVPGKTSQAGAVAGLSAQLGFGQSTVAGDWTWIDAVRNAGYGGNDDEYQASLSSMTTGRYYYAYRYRYTNQGPEYVYGVLSGGPSDTIDLAHAGVWVVQPLPDEISIANLQWPPVMTTVVDELPPTVYGRVYIPGKTDTNMAWELVVHAGVGTRTNDFVWYPAQYNQNYGAFNEFRCDMPATNAVGTYAYVYRFTYRGTNVQYGHVNGMQPSIVLNAAGAWYVVPEGMTAGALTLWLLLAQRRRCGAES
jgi:hypothetical protein